MKGSFFERASAVLSLGLLAGLALAAWLLTELALRPIWETSARGSGQLNAEVRGAQVIQTDALGAPKYRIEAPQLFLFEDGRAEIRSPLMLALRGDAPAIRASAQQALVSANQNDIRLEGQARIERDAYGTESAIRIATDWVQFDIDAQTAETTAPVRVTQGNILLTGVGMKFNHRSEQIQVLSQSQMVLPPKETTR